MFSRFKPTTTLPSGLLTSSLFDQDTFYPRFLPDLEGCTSEVIIESPFITARRLRKLLPILRGLRARGVKIVVNTKHPDEHEDEYLRRDAQLAVGILLDLGATVLYTGGHHRKLAILDRKILFEGSLNILSQNDSCEIMRRIDSEELARQMIQFTKLYEHIHDKED